MPKVIQKLYNTCKEVFVSSSPGYVPPPEDIERLRLVLDNVKPTNVGLSPDMSYFKLFETEEVPAVTYLHIYDSDKFSIGIFCLPPSAVIPLHNHPNMTVFSKLLFGTMHLKSYDWVSEAPITQPSHPERRLAKVHIDSDFTAPCGPSILFPAAGGNMHCFTAITSCAVLDVLGPPYSDSEGRHCTYYNTLPFTSYPGAGDLGMFPEEELEKYVWLEEKEKPDDFVVVGAVYRGPRVTGP
uniref:cysteine dioxygenase n=1 Tax=Kalanchoe fedtschenkoi TaxID=63787 RepID=A0A7N0VN67_KALFE